MSRPKNSKNKKTIEKERLAAEQKAKDLPSKEEALKEVREDNIPTESPVAN